MRSTSLTGRVVYRLLSLAAIVLARPGLAHARERPQPFSIGSKSAWYALTGVTTGATMVAHDRGGYVGGEASIVRLGRGGRFVGLYGDGYYDFGAQRAYATGGLELGYKFFGIDAGGASRWGGERAEWGATGRLFLSLGVLSVYGRYAHFFESLASNDANVVQVGALVKLPIVVWGSK